MTRLVGELLRIPPNHVLIASTGVIGVPLPMDKIRAALPKLVEVALAAGRPGGGRRDHDDRHAAQGSGASRGDRGPSGHDRRHRQGRRDARAPPGHHVLLRRDRRGRRPRSAGRRWCGARSTGPSTGRPSTPISPPATPSPCWRTGSPRTRPSRPARGVCASSRAASRPSWRSSRACWSPTARAPRKLVTVAVRGAASRRDALIAARSVANSPLVKTAINGNDPNWGRIMMALGKSPGADRPGKGRDRLRRRAPGRAGDAEGRRASGADSGDHGTVGIRRSRSTWGSAAARIASGRAISARSTCGSTPSTRRSSPSRTPRVFGGGRPAGESRWRGGGKPKEDPWPH